VEKIVLKGGTNFEEKLASNNVFFKYCRDFVLEPENNLVYFIDRFYGQIFKVELNSGKLLKTISEKGQGPAQLHDPISMKIKNKMIFVFDRGFNGIKIFSVEGKLIKEFRLNTGTLGSGRNIDVNDQNEIFVGRIDSVDNTMVSIYDMTGRKVRSLIQFKKKDVSMAKISRHQYLIKLDKKGNIYLLFYMMRKLAKYNNTGKLLWERDIKNEILDQYKKDEYVKMGKETISKRWYIFDLDVTNNNEIIVGHAGGGCMFDEDGNLKNLILTEIKLDGKPIYTNLGLFKIRGNVLMNILQLGKDIFHYKLEEEKK
jgi:hypothetical protein